jgi:hypothetical protein
MASYDVAIFPPARCSDPFGVTKCTVGDSSTEPYIAAHNTLLAHASVFSLYKEKYQVSEYLVLEIVLVLLLFINCDTLSHPSTAQEWRHHFQAYIYIFFTQGQKLCQAYITH